jgi:hypothetical protein
MEVTGVLPVGARSLGGVLVTVSDSTQYGNRSSSNAPDRENTPSVPRASFPEPVVFPRDGTPLDHRPVQLRQARAAQRYKRDGGGSPRRQTPR